MTEVVVTGSSGFIGQHLCDLLCRDSDTKVTGIDRTEPTRSVSEHRNFNFQKIDLSLDTPPASLLKSSNRVFHLAANPEVRIGVSDSNIDFRDNIVATRNLLESLKLSGFGGTLVFASTSTVYGEALVIPTPESFGPLVPISMYGASKLACESLISAYANLYHFKSKIVRFANVVGGSSGHGVIHDFVKKLRNNSLKLEVLGDGTQAKSYVHINDCLGGFTRVCEVGLDVDIFNLGTGQATSVLKIAEIVIEEIGLENVVIETGHGTGENGRGWPGDVKNMLLDCSKLTSLGWKYKLSSDEAVRIATREMKELAKS